VKGSTVLLLFELYVYICRNINILVNIFHHNYPKNEFENANKTGKKNHNRMMYIEVSQWVTIGYHGYLTPVT